MIYSIFIVYCFTHFNLYSKQDNITQMVLLIILLLLLCFVTLIYDSFMNLSFLNNTFAFSRPIIDKFHYLRHIFKIILIVLALKPDSTLLEKCLFLSGLTLFSLIILARSLICRNFYNKHMDLTIIFLTIVRTQYLISFTITVIAQTFTYREFLVL